MIRNIVQLDCSSKMYNYVSFDTTTTIVSKNIVNFFPQKLWIRVLENLRTRQNSD